MNYFRRRKPNLLIEYSFNLDIFQNDQSILTELREQIDQMREEREEERRQLDTMKSNFEAKNALIDELENQLEDIRTKGREKDKTMIGSSNTTTYKIDDSTLRQLFLSFFTAEKSKQPEIAIVMSKILGYSLEVFILIFN